MGGGAENPDPEPERRCGSMGVLLVLVLVPLLAVGVGGSCSDSEDSSSHESRTGCFFCLGARVVVILGVSRESPLIDLVAFVAIAAVFFLSCVSVRCESGDIVF